MKLKTENFLEYAIVGSISAFIGYLIGVSLKNGKKVSSQSGVVQHVEPTATDNTEPKSSIDAGALGGVAEQPHTVRYPKQVGALVANYVDSIQVGRIANSTNIGALMSIQNVFNDNSFMEKMKKIGFGDMANQIVRYVNDVYKFNPINVNSVGQASTSQANIFNSVLNALNGLDSLKSYPNGATLSSAIKEYIDEKFASNQSIAASLQPLAVKRAAFIKKMMAIGYASK